EYHGVDCSSGELRQAECVVPDGGFLTMPGHRGSSPEQEQGAKDQRQSHQLLCAHTVSPAGTSGRYCSRVRRRRRTSGASPASATSTGSPIRLAYLAPSRSNAVLKTSGTGRRSFDRMAISSSSCASQSIALSASSRFSGALRTNRSVAKSVLPTTTARPFPFGAATTATTWRLRLVRGKSRLGSIEVTPVSVPAPALVRSSGVTVPRAAFLVSIVLGPVTTPPPRPAVGAGLRVLSARMQN